MSKRFDLCSTIWRGEFSSWYGWRNISAMHSENKRL